MSSASAGQSPALHCIFIGLSLTSTWGNGHATTYRGLLKELAARGHRITFLECDVPWYAPHRDFSSVPYCDVQLYASLEDLQARFTEAVRDAAIVVVGSYVQQGIAVGVWVQSTARGATAFYDIDTPITVDRVAAGTCEYLSRELIPAYDIYFSFTGGPTLRLIERDFGSPRARPLYCSVDPALYFPEPAPARWDLGYLGTYAADRQAALQELLLGPANRLRDKRFVVAGPQYPREIRWPENTERIEHLPAAEHRHFYNSQRFTLNLTRRDMVRAGYSPSVRLFEAAACGVPILTDTWPGLEEFFMPGLEIFPVSDADSVASKLQTPEDERSKVAERARERVLRFHTAAVRAEEFESVALSVLGLSSF